jgi:hypothetical protein
MGTDVRGVDLADVPTAQAALEARSAIGRLAMIM